MRRCPPGRTASAAAATTSLRCSPVRTPSAAAWHARLVAAARAGCAGTVTGLGVEQLTDGLLHATVGREDGKLTPAGRLGDSELRYLALALVLLTGPGVLAMETAVEVPSALQTLTVLVDGVDRDLDRRQLRELLALAASIVTAGHLRLVGTIAESAAEQARGMAACDSGRPASVTELDVLNRPSGGVRHRSPTCR